MSKKKDKTINVRNPIAPALRDPQFRKKVAKNGEDRAEQRDPWSKKAKHRKQSLDEFYQVGDKVDVVKGPLRDVLDKADKLAAKKNAEKGVEPDAKKKESHAIVRDPHGPANTIGITIDGEYHLVDEDDVELIFEAFAAIPDTAQVITESASDDDYEDLTEWSYAETKSGVRVPISNEEQDILNKCGSPLRKRNMDDREQEVARRMVSRGVLHRHKDNEGIYFVRDNTKLTRF